MTTTTRYYFPRRNDTAGGDVPAPVAPALGSQWLAGTVSRVALVTERGNATNTNQMPSGVASGQALGTRKASVQGVGPALPAGEIAGTARAVFRPSLSNANADMYVTITVRVVSADGATERGVLLASADSALEVSEASVTRTIGPAALTPVTAIAGDRLVIEIGCYRAPSATVARAVTMSVGDPTVGPDEVFVNGDSTAGGVPWVEFTLEDPPPEPDPPTGDQIALVCGDAYGTQLLGDTYSVTVRRGLRPGGLTDDLEAATLTAIVKGSETVNPLVNADVRPRRPIQLRGTLDDGETWTALYTGTIDRVQYDHDPADKDDDTDYRVIITATDLVPALAGAPSEVSVSGNLSQRVAAVMDPTGLAYFVDDPSAEGPSAALATDAKDVVGQLRLIRDSTHALVYINRDGVLVAVSDNARPRTIPTPDYVATDDITTPAEGIHYHDITPTFDTDSVVNVLTVKTLDGATNPEVTYTDETSRTDWGDKARAITVNDGVAETHADLYLASRVTPGLVPDHIAFTVQERFPQARAPHGRAAHLVAACGLELYDTVRVVRNGVPTVDLLVREITHTLTPARWVCGLGLRPPEVLATRWDDVPADLTWDALDPAMTWNSAVHWHPYL